MYFSNPRVESSPVEWAENINDYMNDFNPGLTSANVQSHLKLLSISQNYVLKIPYNF